VPEVISGEDDYQEEIELDGSDGEDSEEEIFDIETLIEEAEITIGDEDLTGQSAELTATGSDAELEILLSPEGQLLETDLTRETDLSEDGGPDLFFPEPVPSVSQDDFKDQISSSSDEDFTETRDPGSTIEDFTIDEITEGNDLNEKSRVVDEIPVKPLPRATKSLSRIAVLAFFSFLIVTAGIFVTARTVGYKIPYLDDVVKNILIAENLFSSENHDSAGNLSITPLEKTVSGKFIENDRAGRLFVIRGKVLNEYSQPRSFIKITAKLYQKGNKPIKTLEVYCGNVIADQDLAAMEFSAISRRLRNKFGDRRSNIMVKSGKAVPFMIVFNQLPDNLDEYSVEVAESAG
jgi:hypothetical protein